MVSGLGAKMVLSLVTSFPSLYQSLLLSPYVLSLNTFERKTDEIITA